MKLFVLSSGRPFESDTGKGEYIYAKLDDGSWRPVYLNSWPKLELGPISNPERNRYRNERSQNWKQIKLPNGVTIG